MFRKVINKKKRLGSNNEFIIKSPSNYRKEFEIIKKFVIDYSNQ